MTKKTIGIVSTMFLPSTGGVERYTLHLGKALLQKGYRVVVIAQNTHHAPAVEEVEGLTVYRFPCWNAMKGRMPLPKPGGEWRRLAAQLDNEGIEYLLVHTRLYPLALYGLRFAKKRKIPAIVLDHSTGHMTFGSKLVDFAAKGYDHILTFLMKRYCSAFYGVSQSVCSWLTRFGIQPRGVLYNAVDYKQIQQLAGKADESEICCTYSLPPEAATVLYAGRLVEDKGVLKLYQALQQANKDTDRMYLLVAGEGPLYEGLSQKTDTWLRVLGNQPFETIAALMGYCDIFCLPTSYPEGFPTTILEAAAAGCYCITTDAGGSKELLSSREYGVILKANTVEELLEEIETALNDPETRIKVAVAASQKVEKEFSWQNTAQKTLEAFGL